MILKDELKDAGIVTRALKPGKYKLDCPKTYCKQHRMGYDIDCLTLVIVGDVYAHWKCNNCLWEGIVGEKPKEATKAIPKDLLRFDPDQPVVLALPPDAEILRKAGVQNVVDYTSNLLKDSAPLFKLTKQVVVAFDNITETDEMRNEVIRRVGAAKCWNVKFYADTCRDTLEKHGPDFICQDVNEASPQPIKGLYEVQDFMDEVIAYYEGRMAAGVRTGWENVDKLYTVYPGQFTVVTGIPNSGKSTWLDALCCNLADLHGWRMGVFSPENPRALHTIKLSQKKVKQPIDPKHKDRMTAEALAAGATWVSSYFKFIFSSSMDDPPTLDWVLDRASDAVLRWGIKGLIIDPWNRIVKKYDSNQTENAYVETALAKILRFAQNHDVHVWLVAHPTKQDADKKTGKFGVPSLYSISGGANFPNMMDNGIVIYRPTGADSEHTTEVWVRKIRFDHIGQVGHTNLKYTKDTGCFEMLDELAATYMFGTADPDEPVNDGGVHIVEAL